MIPEPADQDRPPQKAWPPRWPTRRLRLRALRGRNVVERGCNRIKNLRGLATRYDKHALVYWRVVLASILLWLSREETRPDESSPVTTRRATRVAA